MFKLEESKLSNPFKIPSASALRRDTFPMKLTLITPFKAYRMYHRLFSMAATSELSSPETLKNLTLLNFASSFWKASRAMALKGWLIHHTLQRYELTHWGRVTHICVSEIIIIGSDNGSSPSRRQAIIWTNAGILLIGPLGTNFSEILIGIHTFSFKKMHL